MDAVADPISGPARRILPPPKKQLRKLIVKRADVKGVTVVGPPLPMACARQLASQLFVLDAA